MLPTKFFFSTLKGIEEAEYFCSSSFQEEEELLGTFTLWSRIEEEEYFLSASFQEKKNKNIFLLNTKYSTSRKGVVPLIYQRHLNKVVSHDNNLVEKLCNQP